MLMGKASWMHEQPSFLCLVYSAIIAQEANATSLKQIGEMLGHLNHDNVSHSGITDFTSTFVGLPQNLCLHH